MKKINNIYRYIAYSLGVLIVVFGIMLSRKIAAVVNTGIYSVIMFLFVTEFIVNEQVSWRGSSIVRDTNTKTYYFIILLFACCGIISLGYFIKLVAINISK